MGPTTLQPPATDWRNSKWLAFGELAVVALIFVADWRHLIPFTKTPFLLLFGWLSLRVRGTGWRSIGLSRYRSWAATLATGIACGALLEGFELFISQPLLVRFTGEKPDLSDFQVLTGNLKYTLVALALAWTVAAFGEEMVYRGYLLNRVADLGRGTRRAWWCSLLVVSTVFGFAHTYQGITGVVETALDGALMALMYFGTGRNLSVRILAHGIGDTVDLLLIFLGKYPTM